MSTATHRAVQAEHIRRARRYSIAEVALVAVAVLLLGLAISGLWPPRVLDTSADTGPR